MGQLDYGYSTPKGVAGGLYDLSDTEINTRTNEENDGVLKLGVGVVQGTTPGTSVKLPASGAVSATFEGVVVNGMTFECDMTGKVRLNKNATVGVLRTGKVWVRVPESIEPKYGDAAYLINTGENAGYFTTETGTNTVIKARFIGAVDNGIAPILLFNEDNTVSA